MVGPSKRRNNWNVISMLHWVHFGKEHTLSPQIDRRAHVFRVYHVLEMARHVVVWLMILKNLAFWIRDPNPRSGTWRRKLDDLKRKGIGGVAEAVYATTLLKRVSLWENKFWFQDNTYAGCAT